MSNELLPCPFTEEQLFRALLHFPCGVDAVSVDHWFRDHASVAVYMMQEYMNSRATPQPIDVEKLKLEVFNAVKYEIIAGETIEGLGDVTLIIDHLAASGYLGAPLPRIEGLEDSIEGAEHDYRVGNTVSPNDFDDIIKAARAYAKLQANITKKVE
jgi:hypothetical protein